MPNFIVGKRKAFLMFFQLVLVIGFSVFVGRLLHARLIAKQERVSQPVPYTVVLRQTIHHSNGTVTVFRDITEAFRSDGSRAVQLTPIQDPTTGVIRHLTLASGNKVTIDELTSLKSTYTHGHNMAMLQRDPSSKCLNSLAGNPMQQNSLKEIVEGEETISGMRTVRISDNGGITDWLALDYGCAVVKKRWDFGKDGGVNEYHLISLIPGEPDPSIFEVPAAIREVSPSERMDVYLRVTGKNCDTCSQNLRKAALKQDAWYSTHRPVK